MSYACCTRYFRVKDFDKHISRVKFYDISLNKLQNAFKLLSKNLCRSVMRHSVMRFMSSIDFSLNFCNIF